jgi:hypothetical protein
VGGLEMAVFFFSIAIGVLYSTITQTGRATQLARFAADNGMMFENDRLATDKDRYRGLFFTTAVVRIAASVRTSTGIDIEIGNRRVIGASSSDQGYIRVGLPKQSVHMMLAPKKGIGTPADIQSSQFLSLEGDFDKYFKLYVPQGQERDALYIFTPDVMAQFIDGAYMFFCEIVEDQLYLYSLRPFALTDAGIYEQTMRVLKTILPKFDKQLTNFNLDPQTASVQQQVVKSQLKRVLNLSDYVPIIVLAAAVAYLQKTTTYGGGLIIPVLPVILTATQACRRAGFLVK